MTSLYEDEWTLANPTEPFVSPKTRKAPGMTLGARGGVVRLDQRIEPLPPRAVPQSTIIFVVCWHMVGLAKLMG
jgi:hypothetical protein